MLSKTSNIFSLVSSLQISDLTKEEIIGKFINLTKAEKSDNIITVVTIGQAIKDVVHDGRPFNQGQDIILATQKIVAVVERNPSTGKLCVRSFRYEN